MKITLKAARVNKGLTQVQCAKMLGICKATYQNYETGTTFPDVVKAKEMASLFGIPLDDLIFLQTD